MMIDEKNLPRIIEKFSDREINWVFKKLGPLTERVDSFEQRKKAVEHYLHTSTFMYAKVHQLWLDSKSHLLPDEEIEWIDRNNSRLLRWVKYYFSNQENINSYTKPEWIHLLLNSANPDLAFYDHLVSTLDSSTIDIEQKRSQIEKAKSAWSDLIQKDKKLAWVNKKDAAQIEWAWSYITEHSNQANQNITYKPMNSDEKYSYILTVFDCWSGHPAEQQIFQDKMKKAWAQQKYRASLKGRKQTTFVLSIESKTQLQKMAISRNVNLNQMLEHIIQKEYISRKAEENKK